MDQSAYFEQMRIKRKTEILNTARNLMLANGPSAFNMQQLARTLDISTVTLYKYYKNSDDIVCALQQNISQELDFTLKHALNTSQLDLNAYLTHIYMTSLEHREDMTLLFLFNIYGRFSTTQINLGKSFFDDDGTFYVTIKELLSSHPVYSFSEEELTKKAHFIQNLFTAQIQQISFINDLSWNNQKKKFASQIHYLLELTKHYLDL